MQSQKLICLVGASGSGKNHFQNLLINKLDFVPLVSNTTRNMRDKEQEGVEYHFLDYDDFNSRQYLQHNYYADNYYGLDTEEFFRKMITGKNMCIIVTYDGVKKLKNFIKTGGMFYKGVYFPNALNTEALQNIEIIDLFIDISVEEAIRRVLIREASDSEKLKRIEQIAAGETIPEYEPQFTYKSIFNIYEGQKCQSECDEHFINFVKDILKEDE